MMGKRYLLEKSSCVIMLTGSSEGLHIFLGGLWEPMVNYKY